ncbi:MAG: baseplate J/gp47 family protein [Candidatus Paceibacterota bacterium]|jgi:hypothetical protein
MTYLKSFDEIYNDILTAHFNKSGNTPDLLIRIIYSAVAVVAWGCYRFAHYVSRQQFPDTSDSQGLEKHAKTYGINKESGETDDELLGRINDNIQRPDAGGNRFDWPRWAKEVSYTHDAGELTEWIETVKDAIVVENSRGGGTVNLVVTSDRPDVGFEEVPTAELLAEIGSYIETKRVLGLWDYLVIGASQLSTDITIDITADDFDACSAEVEAQLNSFIQSMIPGQTLTLSKITSIADDAGATDVSITAPSGNVVPENGPLLYGRIWPGTITIGAL